jgi:hypothetical protein
MLDCGFGLRLKCLTWGVQAYHDSGGRELIAEDLGLFHCSGRYPACAPIRQMLQCFIINYCGSILTAVPASAERLILDINPGGRQQHV